MGRGASEEGRGERGPPSLGPLTPHPPTPVRPSLFPGRRAGSPCSIEGSGGPSSPAVPLRGPTDKAKNRQGQNRNRRDQSFVVRESMRLGAPCCPQTAPPVPRGFEPPASQASRQQATGQAARAPVTSCKSATSARDRLQERSARLLTAGFDLRTSIEPRYSRCRQATSARNKLPSARPVC